MELASRVFRLNGEKEEETGEEEEETGAKHRSEVRGAQGPSSSIFDDLDLGSTRKPGPKAKLPVPVEGGLVRSPAEKRKPERKKRRQERSIESSGSLCRSEYRVQARRGSLSGRSDRSGTLILGAKSEVRGAQGPSSSIFDDLDLGSTRKPGPKAKLPVPVEGGLVRSPAEVGRVAFAAVVQTLQAPERLFTGKEAILEGQRFLARFSTSDRTRSDVAVTRIRRGCGRPVVVVSLSSDSETGTSGVGVAVPEATGPGYSSGAKRSVVEQIPTGLRQGHIGSIHHGCSAGVVGYHLS
ncbi:hypothetical protein WN48_04428 [Eufriesea mexicana]|uniref:Uncharacterized protein n=1 Tax=Eufriesea mexicana TaxID=516756 RepID=A0A310SA19_9HYME|nr:hypothetical protein WN48_04428 [Eufriesea mexicana]